MATTSAQQHRWTYDVFVSFRGDDIRKSFMDHLFKDFRQKGIHVFRDDTDLTLGENISPNLDQVIKESRFLIVIFSKNYASSSWCLRELVKILECMETGDHKHEVRIIFYDVKPDVVRKQTGSYAEAFAKHQILNRTEVAKWKEALIMAANLSGWDLQDMANGFESKFIDSISKEILKVLCREPLHVGENLVGVDAHVNEMNLVRFVGSDKVNMIGICGISGLGKTTLAKAIYNSMHIHFEECIFCEDVAKQQGITQVQMQLIDKIMKTRVVEISSVSEGITIIKQRMPTKPILLVLDDVDDREQLEALAGSPDWFSPGSLIIFTGKDKQLFHSHKVDEIYAMPVLLDYDALELFSLYAFGGKHRAKDFMELAYQVVKCLQGHPLALKVLGCSLYEKPLSVWKSELERLKTYPNAKIQQKLRPSFNGLDFDQQRIFLDIACSFIGENKDFAASVINSEDCTEDANIDVLVDKSLITISPDDNSLHMHELIRSMAREIVREESNSPGRRSRLWIPSDVHKVLNENKATETVEVLDLLQEESNQKVHIDCKAFAHMKNLRILKICDKNLGKFRQSFDLKLWDESKVNYHGKLKFLSNKLRLLYWHGFPFKCFPSDFYPENIVAIDLSYSHIKNLWTSPKCFRRLKVMKLKHCRNLTSTPDFTMITNLSELILEGCVNLVKVHPSFGMLKKLVVLNMRDCKKFRRFPCKVEMDSLEVVILSGCSKLEFGQCEEKRSRRWTSISQLSWLPSKMQHPQNLVMPSLADLCFLRELNLNYCNISEVSDSIGGLPCLESLKLSGNNFTSLPGCLTQLSHLNSLILSLCKKLEVLPEIPPNLRHLNASSCTSLYQHPPNNYYNNLSTMYFGGCPNLFRNLTQVSMSQPLPDIKSSTASHSYRNLISYLLHLMESPSNTSEIFYGQERQFYYLTIVYHGNRIPQWFTNQSIGNQLQVELPPNFCYNKLRGYAICVLWTPKKSYPRKGDIHATMYHVYNFDGTALLHYGLISRDYKGIPKSDLIWFCFTTWIHHGWQEAKNFVTFLILDDDEFEVKACGVRLVFDEDIQDEEADFSITQDLPTPTQDGGAIYISRNGRKFFWSWW